MKITRSQLSEIIKSALDEYDKDKMKCNTPQRAAPGKKQKKTVKGCKDGKEKIIHYGARGMEDYTQHKDKDRRKSFRARHKCKTAKDPLTARHWACKDLWESYFPLSGIDTQRLIYSPSPITGFKDTQQTPFNPKRFNEKPKGLWYACGTEWADFVNSAGWQSKYKHLYELELNHYEILFIKSDFDFEKFERMYGVKGPGKWDYLSIDWPKVASHYAGIEICPYRGEKRMSSEWYYGWDVASGCVWSSEGFASIKEIPLDFHGEEFSWDE